MTNKSNIAQISRIGGQLYFCTNDTATTSDASIWSMPLAGGTATELVDLSKVTGWVTGRLANAMTTDGAGKVYVALWTGGEIFEYDIATKKASFLMKAPNTKRGIAACYPVNMHYRNKKLEIVCLYGDVIVIDPATKKVDAHYYQRTQTATGYSEFKNSGVWNPDAGDYLIGTRDGALEALIPVGTGQNARRMIPGVGGHATASSNSCTGVYYHAGAGSYSAYDAGCAGKNTPVALCCIPTSVGHGVAASGNAAFQFGIYTTRPKDIAILVLGGSKLKLDLKGLGLAGCNLLTAPVLMFGAVTAGPFNGGGSARLPMPLPNAKLSIHTQWILLNPAPLGFDNVSDARTLTLK